MVLRINNNKGWIRIAEAFLAISLISGVMVYLYTSNISNPNTKEISSLQKTILDEIIFNDSMRSDILMDNPVNVEKYAANRIPAGFNFTIKICEVENICSLDIYKNQVFANERIVSSNLQTYAPKKLKLFMWRL